MPALPAGRLSHTGYIAGCCVQHCWVCLPVRLHLHWTPGAAFRFLTSNFDVASVHFCVNFEVTVGKLFVFQDHTVTYLAQFTVQNNKKHLWGNTACLFNFTCFILFFLFLCSKFSSGNALENPNCPSRGALTCPLNGFWFHMLGGAADSTGQNNMKCIQCVSTLKLYRSHLVGCTIPSLSVPVASMGLKGIQ